MYGWKTKSNKMFLFNKLRRIKLIYFTFFYSCYKLELGGVMEQKIIKLIAEKLNKKVDEIKMESRLVEDLGADSLDVVELVMSFEDEFGIALPDEDVANLKTIKDIVDYITNLKK